MLNIYIYIYIYLALFSLRVLARHAGSVDEEKRHLLDSVGRLQEAVSLQEHALLRARSWAPTQEVGQTHTCLQTHSPLWSA